MSQQYLIKSLSDDLSFNIKTGFMDILRPNSVPSSELDSLSDHAVHLSNGIHSFVFVNPGILCTFEVFYGTAQEERAILQEILENVEQEGLKKAEIIEKKYRVYTFINCSTESPAGRSNVVFDRETETWLAENCRGNAADMAEAMGIELLDAEQYEKFQHLGQFDQATSTWLKTEESMRADGYGLDSSRCGLNLDISETRATCHHDAGRFRGRLVV
jgi:hypothetical protein